MLLVQCWTRLCGGDLKVKAFHCQAMAGMWFVRWQECGTHTHTHIYLAFQTHRWAQMLKRYGYRVMWLNAVLFKIFYHLSIQEGIRRMSSTALWYGGRNLDTRPWDRVAHLKREIPWKHEWHLPGSVCQLLIESIYEIVWELKRFLLKKSHSNPLMFNIWMGK